MKPGAEKGGKILGLANQGVGGARNSVSDPKTQSGVSRVSKIEKCLAPKKVAKVSLKCDFLACLGMKSGAEKGGFFLASLTKGWVEIRAHGAADLYLFFI